MAVDSRDKRASVLGLGLAALLILPEPGTLDQGDRQQLAYSYRGISAEALLEADPTVITVAASDRTVAIEAVDRAVSVADDRTVYIGPKGAA